VPGTERGDQAGARRIAVAQQILSAKKKGRSLLRPSVERQFGGAF